MSEIKDKVAPVKYEALTVRSKPKWIDSDLTERRRLTRKYDRKYKKNKTDHNKYIYIGLQREYRNRLRWNRKRHVNKVIEDCNGDAKKLFSVINDLVGKEVEVKLPEYDGDKHLADDFMNYFINKIKCMRSKLGHFSKYKPHIDHSKGEVLEEFDTIC